MVQSDVSIQELVEPWWEGTPSKTPEPGMLVWAFVPYVDQVPYTFIPVGRKDPKKHEEATVRIERLEITKSYTCIPPLPVAAMSLERREVWSAYKAKKRPCLILSGPSSKEVDGDLTKNLPKKSYAKTVLLAPYYGADQEGRAGYSPQLMERIRHAEYPQFFADSLPIDGKTKESILRLDHLQPFGFNFNSFELTGFKLSAQAFEVMSEWLHWRLWGGLPAKQDPQKKSILEFFWDFMNE